MEKSKLLTFAVVGLLLLNFATLGFIFIQHPPRGFPPQGMKDNAPADFIVHELNFNDTQKTEFMKLVAEHRKDMDNLREKDRENHKKLFDQLGISDTLSVNSVLQTIGNTQSDMAKITFTHFQKVNNLCTPEQRNKFNTVIQAALRMMAQPPH